MKVIDNNTALNTWILTETEIEFLVNMFLNTVINANFDTKSFFFV